LVLLGGDHRLVCRKRGDDARRRVGVLQRNFARTVLIIVVAITGDVFGQDAAEGAISQELDGLMGAQSADLLQTAIRARRQ
jgi:hypothetical protein